jgi:Cdc6-like AAA superfamily ATPase
MTDEEWKKLSMEVSTVFTPAAPIDAEELFAGRFEQLRQVVDAVNQKGQHAIIFGERGVGKTSLANVISAKLSRPTILAPRINCDSADTYSSLWKKIFDQINLTREVQNIGFGNNVKLEKINICEQVGSDIVPDNVRQVLTVLSAQFLLILIIDEFDRISKSDVRATIADTIKTLSDHAISSTIVLVGVADSVDDLISEHHSIERALVQIQMPRMSNKELYAIIDNGLKRLGMSIEGEAKQEIALLSKGLPHYAHLLGLHSVRSAIDAKSLEIRLGHVEAAIAKALEKAQQTTQNAYHKATMSSRKDNIYSQVLLACALAKTDDLGYFSAGDVRIPLTEIMGKPYDIPSYSRHLYDFCETGRGPILQKTGIKHRYKFRFINPLMQPYIVMQGRTTNIIDREKLTAIKTKQT